MRKEKLLKLNYMGHEIIHRGKVGGGGNARLSRGKTIYPEKIGVTLSVRFSKDSGPQILSKKDIPSKPSKKEGNVCSSKS